MLFQFVRTTQLHTLLLQLVYSVMETYISLSLYYYLFDIVNIIILSFSFLSLNYKVTL